MPVDSKYAPVPYVYKSRGLIARDITDQVPQYSYLDMLNCLERSENSLSSRYGITIINRDPNDTFGGVNYPLPAPVTSLAKLIYLGQPHRYAGLENGHLFRRDANTQGPYEDVYPATLQIPLSGEPFGSIVTNCFETSQPYLFIYDLNASIKDNGTLGQLQLTGIDPSPYTANAIPYSPLLTLIDNFAAANSYTLSGDMTFTGSWASTPIITFTATGSQLVTDFPEFFGVQQAGAGNYPIGGTSAVATAIAPHSTTTTATAAGFPSVAVTGTETVSVSAALGGGTTPGVFGHTGSCNVVWSYSIDSGVTWTPFYSISLGDGPGGAVFDIGTITFPVPGITNISTLQLQITASSTATGSVFTATGTLNSIVAIVAAPSTFGPIANGMLSLLAGGVGSNPLAIISIASITPVGSQYTQLLVTTLSAHGYSAGVSQISIYASSNDLVDGFYLVQATPSATTYVVDFLSNVALSATGGVSWGHTAIPAVCVLNNLYSNPYPNQLSAWGFFQQVPLSTTSFPVNSWMGTIGQNATASVGNTIALDLSQQNQITDDDLIVITLAIGDPAAISSIRLQFDVAGSGYTSSYYYKDLSPAYYQSSVQSLEDAYTATEQQIFADTLGLLTNQPPNSTTAQLQPGNISTGQGTWVAIYLRRGDFVPVGSAGESGLDWSAITGWQLVITTNTVGSSDISANGLYLQWGYGPSSFGGVGYDYRYTYYNAATGTESNPSPTQRFDPRFGYLSSLVAPTFLRQAVQVVGQYSFDPQVTHVRIYRRGGTYSSNWFQIDQIPNIVRIGPFYYKDVIPDAVLAQAYPLLLDNDPPVTSSLQTPIQTTLLLATSSPGTSIYSTYAPQLITVAQSAAVFVLDQIVTIGFATSLEEVRVTSGGTGQFSAIVRLQHNAGEPVNVFSIPRQPCNLCELAYGQVWLAGDTNNPHYLYFSKNGRPENFSPAAYIPVGSPKFPITALWNWRGNLFVRTTQTWWLIIGGAQPYAQPTGSMHGSPAVKGITQSEQGLPYRSPDGLRLFQGSDGVYMSLPIEFVYRQTPQTPLPLADPTQIDQDIMAYYNNDIFVSYVSLNDEQRYRLIYSCVPEEAEILTREGWKTHDQLVVGEEVLAFDVDSQTSKWTALKAISVQDFDGELSRWKAGKFGKKFSFDFTPNHSWAWREDNVRRLRDGSKRVFLKEGDSTPFYGNIIQAAPLDQSFSKSLLTPREAAILGWLVTDGSITVNNGGRRSSRIYKAQKSIDIPALDTLLDGVISSKTPYSVKSLISPDGSSMFLYLLTTDFTEELLGKCGFSSEDDLVRIALSLNAESAKAMLDAMMAADGHVGRQSTFHQKAGRPQTEAVRILAVICGVASGVGHEILSQRIVGDCIMQRTPIYYNPQIDCEHIERSKVAFTGKVWCPTTDFGTWVCRYRGSISITGNTTYQRYRIDDIAATAMLWEQDTNLLLVGVQIGDGTYYVCEDQTYGQDYDDGGWLDGELVETPIDITITLPFNDLGQPHFPKQFNVLETDVNTQSQPMTTTLTFNTEPPITLNLPSYTGNSLRNKKQFQITAAGAPIGSGQQAYSMSLQHTMAVTVAPIFYQENIYAAVLADYRTSFDTYWLKLSTDQSKIVKQCYFDYTSTQTITINLYADGSSIPYYSFTLPPEPTRLTVRRLFIAWKPRLWRMIALCDGDFQFWSAPQVESKGIREGSTFSVSDLGSNQP